MAEKNVKLVEVNGLQFYINIKPSNIKPSDCVNITHYSVYYKGNMNLFFNDVVIGNYSENDIFDIIVNGIKESLEY